MDDATRELFDANAATYDRVNTLISLGLDARWRDWAARRAVEQPTARVLDAFAGTGLVGLRAAALGAEVTLADGSQGMLAAARRRVRDSGLDVRIVTVDLAAERPEIAGAPFDAVTMVFGVRYLDDPVRVVRALAALLREGGAFVIVDFVEPGGSFVSRLAGLYFFRVLPLVASLLVGRREFYDRLTVSTHQIGAAERLVSIATQAGLQVVETRTMGFGLVCGVVGRHRTRASRLTLGADRFRQESPMTDTTEVTLLATGFLHSLRREAGLPARVTVEVPPAGVSARSLALGLGLPPERIEGIFHNHLYESLDATVLPGDRVAFVPYGTPASHPAFFGGFDR